MIMTKQLLRALFCLSLVVSAHGQCLGETTRVACTVVDVSSIDVLRVHVRCLNRPNGIDYFAVPIDPLGAATRLTEAGTAAMQNPTWTLSLEYCPADNGGANIGCETGNCRLLRTFALLKP
jgi:hypothetical protein